MFVGGNRKAIAALADIWPMTVVSKGMRLGCAVARALNSAVSLLDSVLARYQQAEAQGLGGKNFAAVHAALAVFQERTG